uniref:NADH-ubiquinone oxidoreductase chain 4L n=1 Tax=Hutchinsoniella macracantha TaxID=84335 RepID=Q6SKZ6_9CRUS|nr:NADH dehydrogenase subunit 4L [Hutchinsoniella macracantha]
MMHNLLPQTITPLIMFWMSLFMFSSQRKHLLSTLITLEMMGLSLFWLMNLWLTNNNSEMYFSLLFLTFLVCEGTLGLTILISILRTHGNNNFQSFNILQC